MKKTGILVAMALMMANGAFNCAIAENADPATVKAQANEKVPVLTFNEMIHDFGTFHEEEGRVTYVFNFKNTGSEDLILQKVRASCGCTTPSWSQKPVAPGDTGYIKVTYNASGRPGSFTKTITVTSNAGADQRLKIKGEVIPKVKKPEEEYPFNIGDFRLKNQNVYMRTIEYPNTKTERIQVMNNGTSEVALSFQNVPKYMTVTAKPEKLAAQGKGVIEVKMDSKAAETWGDMQADFDVAVNGKVEKGKSVSVHSTIVENFSNMTPEQKADAPQLKVASVITLGNIDLGKKKKFKFEVTNNGKSDLILRNVKVNNPNVSVSYSNSPIKAGKKGVIKLVVDASKQKEGDFNYRATIICNDPNRSTTGITLSGTYKQNK